MTNTTPLVETMTRRIRAGKYVVRAKHVSAPAALVESFDNAWWVWLEGNDDHAIPEATKREALIAARWEIANHLAQTSSAE